MLFIHDHTFVVDNGKHYTTGSLNQQVMNRYKDWFGDVSVFATKKNATEKDKAYIREENYVENVGFELVDKKYRISYLIQTAKKIQTAVQNNDCVVVRMSIFGAIGAYYARKNGVPYLIEMVACPWDSLWYHSFKGKLVAPFMTLLTKYICEKAPWVVYVTNEFLQKRYPTKGYSIGCSDVELTEINEDILNSRINKINSMKDTKTLKIATLANINVRYKGQELVIRSIKKLKKDGINVQYYLIGGGDSAFLSKVADECGVSENVHIIGPKPHEEVFSLIDDIDIYVQPSLQEGLPRAVIEALSRGCPVIGSSTGGIPELIDSECVFKKGNIAGFIDIIKNVDIDFLVRNAERNFSTSKQYEKTYLDNKRTDFYSAFINSFK